MPAAPRRDRYRRTPFGLRSSGPGQSGSEAAEFYQPVAELKGVALIFTSSGELSVAGDPLLLAQAIGNLIDNALKFAQEKGTITVQAVKQSNGPLRSASRTTVPASRR